MQCFWQLNKNNHFIRNCNYTWFQSTNVSPWCAWLKIKHIPNHLLKKTSAENVPAFKSRFISSWTAPVTFLTLLRGTKWRCAFTFLWQVQFHRETQGLRVTPWPVLSVTNVHAMTLSQGLKYIFYKKNHAKCQGHGSVVSKCALTCAQ